MRGTEEQIFLGIPTFMGSPYIGLDEVKGFDVAVLGIWPWDVRKRRGRAVQNLAELRPKIYLLRYE